MAEGGAPSGGCRVPGQGVGAHTLPARNGTMKFDSDPNSLRPQFPYAALLGTSSRADVPAAKAART